MVRARRSLRIPRPDLLPLRLREILWEERGAPPAAAALEKNDPASNEPAPRSSRVIGFIPVSGGTPPN